jgi:hypothetical protein
LLTDGVVLVVGGTGAGLVPAGEIFDPALDGGAGRFVSAGNLVNPRELHATAPLAGARALVTGGSISGNEPWTAQCEVYQP